MMKSTLYLFGQFSSIRTLPRNIGLRILLWREKGPVLRRLFIFFLARTAHGVFQLLDSINFHVKNLMITLPTNLGDKISLYPECISFWGDVLLVQESLQICHIARFQSQNQTKSVNHWLPWNCTFAFVWGEWQAK